MNERQQTIKGIYNFVAQNILVVNCELNKIPQGTLINYNKNHIFGIEYDAVGRIPFVETSRDNSFNLRVYSKLPGDNSSQGHVYITEDDRISYLNNSKVVMDIIIDTYMIEKRDLKLKELGI